MILMSQVAGDMKKSVYDTGDDGIVDEANAVKVKGVEVDDTAKADQKVLAYMSASGKIEYISPAPSGATIKSIQQGSFTVPNGNSSYETTIDSIDPDKSILFHLGENAKNSSQTFRESLVYVELKDATTVKATRGGGTYDLEVGFVVVEFESGVSVQRGTITMDGTSTTDTISSVDTDKAFVSKLGQDVGHDETLDEQRIILELTNATTVTARTETSSVRTVSYEVIEFE